MRQSLPRSVLAIAILIALISCALTFASGQTATSTRGVEEVSTTQPSPELGSYYALVIGNNNYQYLSKLQTAVFDAKTIAQLLEQSYGFKVKLLSDANRNDILGAMNEYRRTLNDKSNLVIYYAGHGSEDPDNHEAYWLPVDAQMDNNVNWISADDITADLRAIPSLHILIISDSCYSGVIGASRGADLAITPRERALYLSKVLSSKSRNLMASGGQEPVADGGEGGHSVFAGSLIQELSQMDEEEFTASDLFERFLPAVAGRSQQTPHYSFINNSGHEFGDFVFHKKGGLITVDASNMNTASASIPDAYKKPADPEQKAILSVLYRYRDAYESESVDELLLVWPSLSGPQKNTLNKLFSKINALKMTLTCDNFAVSGNGARVTCSQEMRYTSDRKVQPTQTNPVVVLLSKSDRGWLIDKVEAN